MHVPRLPLPFLFVKVITDALKIATFNANSIRSRMDVILAWLEEHEPDVLCIQETKVQDSEFPADPIRDAGYDVIFKGQKSYNGVATLSRNVVEHSRTGFDDDGPADEPRLLEVRIDGVTLLNTYVPQGREIDHEMYPYKVEWFHRLRHYFDQRFKIDESVIWLGDMNVAHDPIDVHNPEKRAKHVCYHEDARAAFAHCRDWGFVDVFRKHHPEAGHYTYYDYRGKKNLEKGLGWRIDYILTNPALAEACTDCYIDMEPRRKPKPSDHTFMVAEFEMT